MKNLLFLFLLLSLTGCPKSEPDPVSNGLTGKFFYVVGHHQVGNYGKMDIVVTVTENKGKYNVNVVDDFSEPSDMTNVTVAGNQIIATQHIDDRHDTRDLEMILTSDKEIMRMTYTVDFTQATGDFHLDDVILTKQ